MRSYLVMMHPFCGLRVPCHLRRVLIRSINGNAKNKFSVGEAVRRVNRENKYLYGNLIESRGKRRKCLARTLRTDEAKAVGLVSPKEESDVNYHDSNLYPQIQTKLIKVSDGSTSTPLKTNSLSSVGGEVDAKPPQCDANVVPSTVLKCIKGFPLINHSKSSCASNDFQQFESLQFLSKEYSKRYPSVGKILNATLPDVSKVLLKKWREKMISLLGEEGFLKFNRAQLSAGVQFHAAIQSYLRGASKDSLNLDGQGVSGSWESLSSVISEIQSVRVLEGPVRHTHLLYHGVADCVASYQGEEVLIEWKKSDKPKPTLEKTYDAPVQLSAYVGAMNYDQHYPLQVTAGLVVVAYSDASPADVFHLPLSECNKYWNLWLERLQLYWSQQQENRKSAQEFGNKEL
ncbi:mitochondrial genome maintenance exonuclease 1-like [Ischnura elegans]|uniref:mitochondrial genome maintenance exonuclease 1-like n=1 Tax=Ischnura elegans TaxID=197161 RepID=UPI001ED86C15|nr:mitochondrial genome maintenance exonuclease 1-like [Ischnura elegans]